VQLFDGRDGRSVWGNTFESERTARDLFDLQDQLTRQVVGEIAGSYCLGPIRPPGRCSGPPGPLRRASGCYALVALRALSAPGRLVRLGAAVGAKINLNDRRIHQSQRWKLGKMGVA
jgi:hypothetical protein